MHTSEDWRPRLKVHFCLIDMDVIYWQPIFWIDISTVRTRAFITIEPTEDLTLIKRRLAGVNKTP
jgi:hypothetical protein